MSDERPTVNICQYKVKPGKESEMEGLLSRHWTTLRDAGLATDEPAIIYRGLPPQTPDDAHSAAGTYFEIFSWKTANSPALAHEMPEVMAVWEPMGAICDEMDFPMFERLDLNTRG